MRALNQAHGADNLFVLKRGPAAHTVPSEHELLSDIGVDAAARMK
jgi:hypothetical protein